MKLYWRMLCCLPLAFLWLALRTAGDSSQLLHAAHEVYLVTACSFDRYPLFLEAVKYWDGPVIAVVSCINTQQLERVSFQHPNAKSIIRAILIPDSPLYPVNQMRNAAVALVPLESIVFLIDADQRPSTGAYRALKSYLQAQSDNPFLAIVLPAFEIGANSYDRSINISMPDTKAELAALAAKGIVRPFKSSYFPHGHGCTGYDLWWQERSPQAYKAQCWTYTYEPYYAAKKTKNLPQYREDFIGWGGNRVTQVISAWMSGIRFYVDPHHFLVHLPHEPQRRNQEVDEYARETNAKLLYRYYQEAHIAWQQKTRPQLPFYTRALYSITTYRATLPRNALEFLCGDVIQVLDMHPEGQPGAIWLGRNNRTSDRGYFAFMAVSLSWDEFTWCPKEEMLPTFIRDYSEVIQ